MRCGWRRRAAVSRLSAVLRTAYLSPLTGFAACLFAISLGGAWSAQAQDARPVSVDLASDDDRVYSMTVGTTASQWWIPSVGTSVAFERDRRPAPSMDPGDAAAPPSGTVWTSLTLSGSGRPLSLDATVIQVQVDPKTSTQTVSVTGSRAWTIGTALAASLNDTYALRQDPDTDQPDWEASNALRLDFKPSRTALVAESIRSADDGDWHANLRAEQALGGGLSVSASVEDLTSTTPTRTILASFSHQW